MRGETLEVGGGVVSVGNSEARGKLARMFEAEF